MLCNKGLITPKYKETPTCWNHRQTSQHPFHANANITLLLLTSYENCTVLHQSKLFLSLLQHRRDLPLCYKQIHLGPDHVWSYQQLPGQQHRMMSSSRNLSLYSEDLSILSRRFWWKKKYIQSCTKQLPQYSLLKTSSKKGNHYYFTVT